MKSIAKRKQNTVSFGNNAVKALFGSALLMFCMSYANSLATEVILGNVVSNAALCAANLVIPIYSYGIFFSNMICIGSSILYFRNLGECNEKHANEIFGQGLILSVILGILMFATMIFAKEAFLDGLNISVAIRAEAEIFWEYIKYLLLFAPLEFLLAQFLYTDILLTILSNVVLLVCGTGGSAFLANLYGTAGVGLGLIIGNVLCALILCIHFFRKENILSFRWHLSLKDMWEMCRLSLVDASKFLDGALLVSFINAYVVGHFSEEELVVTSVAIAVFNMSVAFDSVGAAMMPIAEVYLGEKNYQDEKSVASFSLKLSVLLGGAVMLLILIFASLIPFAFGVSDSATVVDCARTLRILALSMPLLSVTYMLISQYITIRKIVLALVYEWSKALILPLLCILLLGELIGFNGIWVAILLASVLSVLGIALVVRVLFKRDNKSILLVPNNEYPSFSRSYYASEESAIIVRDDIERFLSGQDIPHRTIMLVMLCVEEMTNLLIKQNPDRRVIVQYIVRVESDGIRVFERDNGVVYDLMDTDANIGDLRQYIFDCLIDTCNHKQYLMAINYNRCIFCFKI